MKINEINEFDDGAADERPLLLVVGTGMRHYREYLLKSISTQYRVHLLEGAEPRQVEPQGVGQNSAVNAAVSDQQQVAPAGIGKQPPQRAEHAVDQRAKSFACQEARVAVDAAGEGQKERLLDSIRRNVS